MLLDVLCMYRGGVDSRAHMGDARKVQYDRMMAGPVIQSVHCPHAQCCKQTAPSERQ